MTATLKVGRGRNDVLHVFSCYAPTFAASREEKDKFSDILQQALLAVPPEECLVMLGDFNARVGSRVSGNEEWWYERGPHGHGVPNEAGRELLSFLSINEATVCNTWFAKKDIYKQTWQHPKSKQWHCIDYAIMRKAHRRRCLDVTVVRGAQCNTDHMMLKVKLQFGNKHFRGDRTRSSVGRFDVSKLQGRCVDERGKERREGGGWQKVKEEEGRGKFASRVCAKMKEQWSSRGSVEEKWDVMKSALCEAAGSILGSARKRHADWFRESEAVLKPLLDERSRLHARWLSTGSERDRKKFAEARRAARGAVRMAKNAWFQRKASEAERGKNGGKVIWRCIRDMQCGRSGLVPVRTTAVKDEDGNMCDTPELQQQRWRRHFTKILNLQSEFSMEELSKVRQRPLRPAMAEPPSEEEVHSALGKMKSGKAGGETGILPEMLKAACCEEEFMEWLLELVKDVWRECQVPTDWCDAVIVPIPKKGDLKQCDNWRGVALLDVVGKVVARILQQRLQKLA